MSDVLKANVREFYDRGWNRGDLTVIDDLFSPQYRDHDAEEQTDVSGVAAAKQFIAIFRESIADLHLAIEDQFVEGSTVTTRWTLTGTHQGQLLGIAATGRPLLVTGISIDRFDEDGRFLEGWGNRDGLAMLRQIGVFPPAAN